MKIQDALDLHLKEEASRIIGDGTGDSGFSGSHHVRGAEPRGRFGTQPVARGPAQGGGGVRAPSGQYSGARVSTHVQRRRARDGVRGYSGNGDSTVEIVQGTVSGASNPVECIGKRSVAADANPPRAAAMQPRLATPAAELPPAARIVRLKPLPLRRR